MKCQVVLYLKEIKEKFTFHNPSINLYVKDVEASIKFYITNFGFTETFRTPKSVEPDHVELKLENFTLGVASISSAKSMHGLNVGTGLPKGEVVLWTNDVDGAYNQLIEKGVKGLSKPHTFIDVIRSAWVADIDGNPIQMVCRIQ